MRLPTALAACLFYAAPASAQCHAGYAKPVYAANYGHQYQTHQQYAPAYVPVAALVYVTPSAPTVALNVYGYPVIPVVPVVPVAPAAPAFAPPPGFKLVPVDPAGK